VSATASIEETLEFTPRFDANGLLPAVVTDWQTGAVLMFAWMNAEALKQTISTKEAHFWSRSRGKIWRKGEESGNTLELVELRTDCDQDVVWLKAKVSGAGKACHTGRTSCFYRSIPLGPNASQAPGQDIDAHSATMRLDDARSD
jgi:phosphoribosyl-AMP cyclohydrolase